MSLYIMRLASTLLSKALEDYDDGEPDVIPIQALGTSDTDMNTLSSHELLLWGLANSSNEGEGGYANRHGRSPVNMFGRPREGKLMSYVGSSVWTNAERVIVRRGSG